MGLWHHHLVTGARDFLESMWPTVRRALDLVLTHQGPQGQMWWGSSPRGFCDEALITGSSSIHHALRCGVAIANELGHSAPEWDLAADRLGHALRAHPELFTPKTEFSMDWFYPVLTGVMVGEQAQHRIDERWDDFVVDGLGIRCVDHRPWVTGAETCEFVLALEAAGRHEQALEQFTNMQHLREADGSYWTGLVYADGKRWPVELSTWTGAVVLLAASIRGEDSSAPASSAQEDKPRGFVCKICGFIYEGDVLPADFVCPICRRPASDFEPLA